MVTFAHQPTQEQRIQRLAAELFRNLIKNDSNTQTTIFNAVKHIFSEIGRRGGEFNLSATGFAVDCEGQYVSYELSADVDALAEEQESASEHWTRVTASPQDWYKPGNLDPCLALLHEFLVHESMIRLNVCAGEV